MDKKIAKKITGFLTDERGTISKQNLIRGAITLSAIATTVSVVSAGTKCRTEKDSSPGGLENVNDALEESFAACGLEGDTRIIKWNCETEEYKTVCESKNKPANCNPMANRFNPNVDGRYVHKNADEAYHKNNLGFDYKEQEALIKGTHNHHGQHDKFDVCCQNKAHENHCQHCVHEDDMM